MTSTVRGSGGRSGRDRRDRDRHGRLVRRERTAESGAPELPERTERPRRTVSSRRPAASTRRRRAAEPEDRRSPTRGRYLARRWMALLVVLTVAGVAYLVMFTSLLGVRSVEVIGAKEIPKDAVLKAAAIEQGTPMVRLDADEAAARVAALPRVFEVVVERSWPSTVEILVTERTPVAVFMVGAEVHLVDRTGLDYATARARPPGLPTMAITGVRPADPATKAAVTVLGAIPKQLRTQVTQISAGTPGDVRLTLADGRVVKWGDARDNARKAAVLAPLLTRPGTTFDVATPEFPTTSG